MNKKIIVLIVALFGMIVPISPLTYASVPPAHAATINNLIAVGYVNKWPPTASPPSNFSFTPVSSLIVSAGSAQLVKNVNNVVTPIPDEYLALNFSSVTINSGQFSLYLSKNGLNIPTSGDIPWVKNIFTSEVTAKAWTPYTYNGSTYYLGFDGIVGPAPTDAPLNTTGYFVKAYTGSPSNLPVSQTRIGIYPSLIITPSSGPAGQTITVSGAGFYSNGSVKIYYTYHVAGSSANVPMSTTVTANSAGQVSVTIPAPELKLETPAYPNNKTNIPYPSPYNLINFSAQDTKTGLITYSPISFTELPREFTDIAYYSPATAKWISVTSKAYNGTAASLGYVKQGLTIAGENFEPSSTITINFDGTTYTTTTNPEGSFSTTITVPVVGRGTYTVYVSDPLAVMEFDVSVQPTLIVTPTTVTPGSTLNITGYGFDSNYDVNISWLGIVLGENNIYSEIVPIGSNGVFTTTLTVPTDVYGGNHSVVATDNAIPPTTANASVYVNPLAILSPATAPLGTNVTLQLSGLASGYEYWNVKNGIVYAATQSSHNWATGASPVTYEVAYDNIPTYIAPFNSFTGAASFVFYAAGYPMLHAVQLVETSYKPYNVVYTAWLNVTGTTNTEAQTTAAIKSLNSSVSSQLSSLSSSLSSINTSVSSQLGSISSSLTSISNMISDLATSLSSDYSSLSSSLSSLSSSLSSMNTSVSSQLGSISSSISSDYSSLSSSLSSLSSSLSSMNSSVSSQLSSINSSISSMSGTMTTQYSSIMSSLTSISTMISDLKTSLSSDYSSISSSLSSLSSSVSSISSTTSSVSTTVSSISPSVSSLQSSVSSLESSVSSLMTYLLVVAVLAIIIIVLELVLLVRKR